MLSLSLVEQIVDLLNEGELSQRRIAERVGVSRGTVASIASGRRGLFGRDPESDDDRSLANLTPPERCPKCGYLIYAPCRVCRAREFQENRKLLRAATIRPRVATGTRRRERAAGDPECLPWNNRVA